MSNRLDIELNDERIQSLLDTVIELYDRAWSAREAVNDCLAYLSRSIPCEDYEKFEKELYQKHLSAFGTLADDMNPILAKIK